MPKYYLPLLALSSLFFTACQSSPRPVAAQATLTVQGARSLPSESIEQINWIVASQSFAQAGVRPHAFFENGRLSGYTGCNYFSGTYTQKGDELKITGMSATRKACNKTATFDNSQAELDFLAHLEKVGSFKLNGNTLSLIADGGRTLTFGSAGNVLGQSHHGWAVSSVSLGGKTLEASGIYLLTEARGNTLRIKITGTCNDLFAQARVSKQLIFGRMHASLLPCHDTFKAPLESALIEALSQKTYTVKIRNSTMSSVTLEATDGKIVVNKVQ